MKFDEYSLEKVVSGYSDYLAVKYTDHFKQFETLRKTAPEAAASEAILFSVFKSEKYDVTIGEIPGKGGVDFLVESPFGPFIVEVTALKDSVVEKASGLPLNEDRPGSIKARSFSLITDHLKGKAGSKARQVSGHPVPRLVAICSTHTGAGILLGPRAAEELMTGSTLLSQNLMDPSEKLSIITYLKNSVFFRLSNNEDLEPCRQSISCILLVQITGTDSRFLGLIHPEPAVEFHNRLIPCIPFCCFRSWPLESNELDVQWLIQRPEATHIPHVPPELSDDDLKHL